MKKIIVAITFLFPFFFSSCSSEEPTIESQEFRTRSVDYWFYDYDGAYDGFWEYVDEIDASAELLSRTNWLPQKIKDQFIDAIDIGGVTQDPMYPWEETAYVVKEVLERGGESGNTPTKICYTLWAVQILYSDNGTPKFRYFIPETEQSIYEVNIDPYESSTEVAF